MIKDKNQQLNPKDLEKILEKQTDVILGAVSEKLISTETSIKKEVLNINKKIDDLVTTLDVFLKRLTVAEEEFEMMKADINRMKKIIKEKLGVEL